MKDARYSVVNGKYVLHRRELQPLEMEEVSLLIDPASNRLLQHGQLEVINQTAQVLRAGFRAMRLSNGVVCLTK